MGAAMIDRANDSPLLKIRLKRLYYVRHNGRTVKVKTVGHCADPPDTWVCEIVGEEIVVPIPAAHFLWVAR
jgi:hypothetical protein